MLQQLSERIFYLAHDSRYDRPTLGYIKGDDYSVMIDCGNSPHHLALFNQQLDEKKLPRPKFAIITHWHWDHTFAMHAFEGTTIANSLTHRRLLEMAEWKWTDEAMRMRVDRGEEIAFCDNFIRVEYPDLADIQVVGADLVFEGDLTLNLGGVHCEVQKMNWSHSHDSNIIFVPEEGVYFVGDADSEDFYHNNGQYTKEGLAEIIQFWESKEFNYHIHGHLCPMNKRECVGYFKSQTNNVSH